MSILDILAESAVADGRLFRLHPYEPTTRIARLLSVSPSVMEYLQSDDMRAGQLHAELDSFIGGDKITISMIPRHAGSAFIGLLEPAQDGVFDIRSIDPRPAVRVLGAFVRRDYFVGLVPRTRKMLLTPKDWETAIEDCKREWKHCFHESLPLTGASPNDYLSNWICLDI